jgi:hypothetical protein
MLCTFHTAAIKLHVTAHELMLESTDNTARPLKFKLRLLPAPVVTLMTMCDVIMRGAIEERDCLPRKTERDYAI